MVYVYTFASIFVLAVGYNLMLRFFTKPIIWLGIIGTGAGIIYSAVILQDYHHRKEWDDKKGAGFVLITFVYFLYLVALVYILLILCIYRSIAVSATVLKTAAVIITRNLKVLVLPFL